MASSFRLIASLTLSQQQRLKKRNQLSPTKNFIDVPYVNTIDLSFFFVFNRFDLRLEIHSRLTQLRPQCAHLGDGFDSRNVLPRGQVLFKFRNHLENVWKRIERAQRVSEQRGSFRVIILLATGFVRRNTCSTRR